MTPIKVGDYTVWKHTGLATVRGRLVKGVFAVVDSDRQFIPGRSLFLTLPMALRAAAGAAGIERQRVRWVRPDRQWTTRDRLTGQPRCTLSLIEERPDGSFADVDDWRTVDRLTFQFIGSAAHALARERYAALGGAA